jgi:hypothetical protein
VFALCADCFVFVHIILLLRLYFPRRLLRGLIVLVMLFQMAYSLLSQIHKDSHQWSICVLISHMWHYGGGTDLGPIKHTDLVLLDTEVSATAPISYFRGSFSANYKIFVFPGKPYV